MKGQYPILESFQDPAEIEQMLRRCQDIQRDRRDRFAAAALTGLTMATGYMKPVKTTAENAVQLADALIAALDKP